MTNKKNAPSDQQESDYELLNSLTLPGFAEVLRDVDYCLRPIFIELVLLVAIKEVAKERGLTLSEQLKIWRPFDV
tara:strand:+ start:219 stop:443 length:225 start_codon:yes stop_codon:yes gene_type:complete